jgi:hypothetical protein
MPAITSIAIYDGADTPVEHTFEPVSFDGTKAVFADFGAIALADTVLSLISRVTTGGYRKVSLKFAVPTVSEDTSTGTSIYSLVNKDHVTVDFTFGENSTEESMRNTVAFVHGATDAAQAFLYPILTERENAY